MCMRNKKVLKKGLTVSEQSVKTICMAAVEIMAKEPPIISIDPPVNVYGDIHGQFYDQVKLFTVDGEISSTKYINFSW